MSRDLSRWLSAGFLAAMLAPAVNAEEAKADAEAADPYLWLEDVGGDKALDWVRARNAVTRETIESAPGFAKLEQDLLAILDSDEKIPFVYKQGDYFYNFWTDQKL